MVFNAEDCLLVVDVFASFTLGNNLLLWATSRIQDSDVRICCRVASTEAICRRHKNTAGFLMLVCQSRGQLRATFTLPFYREIKRGCSDQALCIIRSRAGAILWTIPSVLVKPRHCAAERPNLNALRLRQCAVFLNLIE